MNGRLEEMQSWEPLRFIFAVSQPTSRVKCRSKRIVFFALILPGPHACIHHIVDSVNQARRLITLQAVLKGQSESQKLQYALIDCPVCLDEAMKVFVRLHPYKKRNLKEPFLLVRGLGRRHSVGKSGCCGRSLFWATIYIWWIMTNSLTLCFQCSFIDVFNPLRFIFFNFFCLSFVIFSPVMLMVPRLEFIENLKTSYRWVRRCQSVLIIVNWVERVLFLVSWRVKIGIIIVTVLHSIAM